jgi:predicted enzyme related to lactoylglutathione lyase
MTGFVWFHNSSDAPGETSTFYDKLLGWKPSDGPAGLTMFAGDAGPFAGLAKHESGVGGWIPYAQVDDVDIATAKATKLGATVVQKRTKGPAGDFTIVRDPGGAHVALWQKA